MARYGRRRSRLEAIGLNSGRYGVQRPSSCSQEGLRRTSWLHGSQSAGHWARAPEDGNLALHDGRLGATRISASVHWTAAGRRRSCPCTQTGCVCAASGVPAAASSFVCPSPASLPAELFQTSFSLSLRRCPAEPSSSQQPASSQRTAPALNNGAVSVFEYYTEYINGSSHRTPKEK